MPTYESSRISFVSDLNSNETDIGMFQKFYREQTTMMQKLCSNACWCDGQYTLCVKVKKRTKKCLT